MISASEALERPREGNRRFVCDVRGSAALVTQTRRSELAEGQEPFAIILRPYADDLSGARGGNHVVPHLAQVQPSGRRGTLDDVFGCGRTRSPGNLACARKGCRPGERGHVRHARLAAVGIRDSGGLFFNHPT